MRVRLIVPNVKRNTSPVVAYGMRIANIAGGFTATQGTGGWMDNCGYLICEPVTVFDVSTDDKRGHDGYWASSKVTNYRIHQFRVLAGIIARDLGQQCVYLSIDGKVELIPPCLKHVLDVEVESVNID